MAIINDNDMEIIVKGNQEKVIRKMLTNRFFCLLKMPVNKSEEHISPVSSSVFVGFMNDLGFVRSLAIRDSGSKTAYGDCEHYLSIYISRGKDPNERKMFNRNMERRKKQCISVTTPTIKELLSFLDGKELVLITNYRSYGNMEACKLDSFLNELLMLRDEKEFGFILRDENCDIRIYLSRISGDAPHQEHRLCMEDVGSLDIGQRIIDLLHEKSKEIYKEKYYSVELESRSKDTKALYFVTRFHSNNRWKADPVVIVTARIAAFVLPGHVFCPEAGILSPMKITKSIVTDKEYVIDAIHFNSDICYDIAEFEDLIDTHFWYFVYE